ncbi:MAG: hypothetical protein QOJ89_3169 [bacterium]|jgi:hypothetical protein
MRRAIPAMVCVAAMTTAGCESSQTRSARLKAASVNRAPEQALKITTQNPDVRLTATAIVNDVKAKRSAAAITLRNTSDHTLAALPLLFEVSDAAGKPVFTNNSAGASLDLVSVPSLAPGATLTWVDDAIVNVNAGREVTARVGTAAPASARVPAPRISGVRIERDEGGAATAVGRVVNASPIAQQRLVVFATARRGGRIVAAGRAVVPLLRPGRKGARFTVFFVGDPAGAKLTLQAPPVSLRSSG